MIELIEVWKRHTATEVGAPILRKTKTLWSILLKPTLNYQTKLLSIHQPGASPDKHVQEVNGHQIGVSV